MNTITRAAAAAALLSGVLAAHVSAQLAPVRVRLPGYNLPLSLDSVAGPPETISAAFEVTRAAAAAVLEELKIPATTNDPAGLVGNGGFRLLRRFGNDRLSTYFECGTGLSGPQADTWRLTAAVMLWVERAGDAGSRVRIALVAGAQDLDPSTRRSAGCGSTGALETMVIDRIRKRATTLTP